MLGYNPIDDIAD